MNDRLGISVHYDWKSYGTGSVIGWYEVRITRHRGRCKLEFVFQPGSYGRSKESLSPSVHGATVELIDEDARAIGSALLDLISSDKPSAVLTCGPKPSQAEASEE